jgi:hypothetical protein
VFDGGIGRGGEDEDDVLTFVFIKIVLRNNFQ